MHLLLLLLLGLFTAPSFESAIKTDQDVFPLAIIHINDFHARFEETNPTSGTCKEGDTCIGGYARIVTVVKQLLETHSDKNAIYLNAGDNFQGTLWYTLMRWNVTKTFLNLLPADAITLGNHEFDHAIEGCVPFMQELTSPVVVANIDDSMEPTMQGLYQKSTVIERNGRKIGIIGAIVQNTDVLANTGNLKFLDETEAVRKEADLLHANGVDIIIVLSHCGLDVDERMAEHVGEHVDVIVGGHSHTFLYTGETLPGPERPFKEYPVTVEQSSGHKVYIVQAASYARYVGEFIVYFDAEGKITSHEGNPIYLGANIIPDPETVELLQPWKEEVDKLGLEVIGSTLTKLDKAPCGSRECNIANLVNEAYMKEAIRRAKDGEWTAAEIAMSNSGGIRTTIEKGSINFADAIGVLPFENNLEIFELRGDKLLDAMEYSVSDQEISSFRNFLHHAGMKVVFDYAREPGHRVVDLQIICRQCDVPVYEPLNVFKNYKLIMPAFLADGGDGFSMFKDFGFNREIAGRDIDIFVDHIKQASPLLVFNDGRIKVL